MSHEQIWGYKNFPNPTNADEPIIMIVRQDESVITRMVAKGFFMVLFLFLLKILLQNYNKLSENTIWFYTVNLSFYLIICIILLRFAYSCHNYFLSYWTITNLRVIEYNQNNFFHAEIRSFWYKNIQKTEVINESAGRAMSNVADLVIYPKDDGKENNKFVLEHVPNPRKILEIIHRHI